MKIYSGFYILICLFISGCVNLTAAERHKLYGLKSRGITIDHPQSEFENPAHPAAAGALQILPGGGNFYLAAGNGGDSGQYVFGFLNLISWPFSIIWGIPQAVIDAQTINKRELVMFYEDQVRADQSIDK